MERAESSYPLATSIVARTTTITSGRKRWQKIAGRGGKSALRCRCACVHSAGHPKSFTPIWTDAAPTSIRATIIGQLKPAESVRVTWHPIIIRYPRGGSTTTYPRDQGRAPEREVAPRTPPGLKGGTGWI